MSLPEVVADFLKINDWHLLQYVDIGDTADVLVVEKDDKQYALKIRREGNSDTCTLKTEHQVLQYLATTPMRQYVPRVGEWLWEINGFLMERLQNPTQAEKETEAWRSNLARAIQILHSISLPPIKEVADDRPDVSIVVNNRFRNLFQVVLKGNSFWERLSREDKLKLELVRTHYEYYSGLLPKIEDTSVITKLALTHGDLAGDNIMLTRNGHLAIIDWGAARISSALTDIACLIMYANWSEDEVRQFVTVYFNDDLEALEEALPCLQVLSRLYCYHSCVKSLLWLNEIGDEGLDAIGRTHFERLLSEL